MYSFLVLLGLESTLYLLEYYFSDWGQMVIPNDPGTEPPKFKEITVCQMIHFLLDLVLFNFFYTMIFDMKRTWYSIKYNQC